MPTFEQLRTRYASQWAKMNITLDHVGDVDRIARRAIASKARYELVESKTGVPWFLIAALHERESGRDFTTQLAQGDPLNGVSSHIPKGRGPFSSWEDAAYDALVTLKGLNAIKEWPIERIAYEAERYNGWGYYNHDTPSAYLWSFSDIYRGGKYVADGVWSSTATDKQAGVMPLIRRMAELDASIKIGVAPALASAGNRTLRRGDKGEDVARLQRLLNIGVDGDFGPATEQAVVNFQSINGLSSDGIVGPVTWGVLEKGGVSLPPALPNTVSLAQRIVLAMEAAGYALDKRTGEVNIVYVEGLNPDGTVNTNRPNAFDDLRTCIGFDGPAPKLLGAWEATTQSGKRYTQGPIASYEGKPGAAIIALGQQRAWQVGMHRGDHEALIQTGGSVSIYRDINKDYKRGDDPITSGWYGINQHWGYDLPKDDIGPSSAGCLVGRTKAGHREFMSIVKSDPRYKADKSYIFSTTVLEAAAVARAQPKDEPSVSASTAVVVTAALGGGGVATGGVALGGLFQSPAISIITTVLAGLIVGAALSYFFRKW